MMTAADVVAILARLESAKIPYWLDGGWGVDALLGEQTREHDDLDVVVRLNDADRLISVLGDESFAVSIDERPTRLVLAHEDGRRIDCHPVVFDVDGSARQIGAGANGGDAPYPAWGFAGEGMIDGRGVPCLTAKLLVLHHTGYEPQAKDRHNVRLLCERFGIDVPPGYLDIA